MNRMKWSNLRNCTVNDYILTNQKHSSYIMWALAKVMFDQGGGGLGPRPIWRIWSQLAAELQGHVSGSCDWVCGGISVRSQFDLCFGFFCWNVQVVLLKSCWVPGEAWRRPLELQSWWSSRRGWFFWSQRSVVISRVLYSSELEGGPVWSQNLIGGIWVVNYQQLQQQQLTTPTKGVNWSLAGS